MEFTREERHALINIMYNKSLTSVKMVKDEIKKNCRVEIYDKICNIADYRRCTKLNYYGLRMTAERFKDVLYKIVIVNED